MGRISFFLKEAFGSLRRNYFMTIAALVTVFLSIVVLGGVLVFVYTTDALLKEVEQKVEITVYLKTDPDPEPTPAQVEAMQTEIMGWSEVKSSVFVSKEDALARLKEDFKDNPEILEGLTGNPLPASFEIALNDPQTVDTVAARFTGNAIVDEVSYGKEIADKLFSFTSQARNFLVIFIVLLGIGGHPAHLQHHPPLHLRPQTRGGDHETGGSHQLVHPLAVRHRRGDGRVLRGFGRGRGRAGAEQLPGREDQDEPALHGRTPRCRALRVRSPSLLLAVGVVIGAAGAGIGLRRFLKV